MDVNKDQEHDRLKLVRKALGYKSQGDFANTLALGQAGYSDIERGKNKISKQVKKLLEVIHNVNIHYLDTGEGGEENMFLNSDSPSPDSKKSCDSEKYEQRITVLISTIESQQKTIDHLYKNLSDISAERDELRKLIKD